MPKIVPHAREEILEQSRNMLRQVGYDEFNMRSLAALCNLSVGTLYNYFPSKYEIVHAIIQKDWQDVLNGLDDLVRARTDPQTLLHEVYRKVRTMYEQTHTLWVEGSAAMMRDANMQGVRARREEIRGQLVSRIMRCLGGWMQTGGTNEAGSTILWGMDGLIRLILSYSADGDVDEKQALYMIDIVYQGIMGE